MPRKSTKSSGAKTPAKKARLDLRFDPALHARLVKLTSDLDVSVNQFLEAITEWAVENAVLGCPTIDPDGHRVEVSKEPGVVFFGYPSPPDSPLRGEVHFVISFHRAWATHDASNYYLTPYVP